MLFWEQAQEGGGNRGALAKAIAAMNRAVVPTVAIDLPSGLNADTGEVLGGPAVEASYTVTIGRPKIGLVTYPGAEYVGGNYTWPTSVFWRTLMILGIRRRSF